jgi:protoporphyrinogen oxidase
MVGRVLNAVPGLKKQGSGRFFYPRHGYGQISTALRKAAESHGAVVHVNAAATSVHAPDGRVTSVEATIDGRTSALPATHVLSTVPITALARLVRTGHEAAPTAAINALQLRAMVIVYLALDADRFTEFDAHYFPEPAIRITRLSEPKNYSLTDQPGRTVLCAELPCALNGPEWAMSDADLGALVTGDLESAGLGPIPRIAHVQTRRLPAAYPLYTRGYRHAFDSLDRWTSGIEGLITFGRQGLFAHDNTHHTMAMAYALVDCLRADGSLDRDAWARARSSFEDHVVED